MKNIEILSTHLMNYYPFIKPNAKTIYINKDSNHPRNLKKILQKLLKKKFKAYKKQDLI